MSKSNWTDERVEVLKKLWTEGKTASQIAEILGGITRNAVIGKAHRLNLSKRASPVQHNKKRKSKPMVELSKDIPTGLGISLLELKERMCRWPNGDPKKEGFNFCGCSTLPGLPYCAEHAAIAYHGKQKKISIKVDDSLDEVHEEKMIGEA